MRCKRVAAQLNFLRKNLFNKDYFLSPGHATIPGFSLYFKKMRSYNSILNSYKLLFTVREYFKRFATAFYHTRSDRERQTFGIKNVLTIKPNFMQQKSAESQIAILCFCIVIFVLAIASLFILAK